MSVIAEVEGPVTDTGGSGGSGSMPKPERKGKAPLLTAEEVAERLQVHPATVYGWAQIGYLPSIILSEGTRRRCVRFEEEAIERWLKEKARAGRVDRLPGRAQNGVAPVGQPQKGGR